ncbi:MAG TPA: nitroreductase family protein [Fibrobacteria bacterium]|nr:nitroreductase family protein [Fibrobacteria bacterium]
MPESDSLALWARRAAIKKFDPSKAIGAADWDAILQALHLAPSAYGLQPYRVVDVRDPAKRAAIREGAPQQAQVTDAAHLLVFALVTDFGEPHLDAHLARTKAARGTPDEALGIYRGRVVDGLLGKLDRTALLAWQARQAYIGLAAAMYQASQLGIDTCPLEAMNLEVADRVLDLGSRNLASVVGLAVGYRSEEDVYCKQAKVRLPRHEFVLEI